MLGGLCMTRKACRAIDDESPDDASGIVSNCSIKCNGNACAQWWCVAGRRGDEGAYIPAACRVADSIRVH